MSLARAAKRLVDQIDRAHDAYESQVADPVDSKATVEASTPLGAETSAVASSNLSSKDL